MSEEKQKDIALFRYRIIAPVLNETGIGQMRYFRQMSERVLDVPWLGKKRFKPDTFKGWLRDYRNGGFDALKPKPRIDKGTSRKIDEHLGNIIREKTQKFSSLSCSGIYRLLISEGEIEPAFISEGAVRKYIKANNLKVYEPVCRKKFEKEHINELWIADCMHGPYIVHEGKKRKVFLIGAIDDCSRVIVGARFFFHENSFHLEAILKEAMIRFGAPKMIYADNGGLFVSAHLQLACARLGIALVHSKPYDSPSRGKIERFFRTTRCKFLSCLDLEEIDSIEELNIFFSRWLNKEYHKSHHSGINARPLDKWMDDMKNTSIKRISAKELDQAFYITIKRRVKNDSTISVNSILYEVPPEFIGKTIQLRYPSDKLDDLTIYENDAPVYKVKRVNPIENANPPAWEIKFDRKGEDHD